MLGWPLGGDLFAATDAELAALAQVAEREFKDYLQAPNFSFAASGLLALQAALYAVGVREESEVVCDGLLPFAIMATLNLGARPVVVDIDDDSLTMSPQALERSVSAQTRAVVCTAAFGVPPRTEALCQVIRAGSEARLVQDHAQAFGSRVGEHMAGAEADLVTLSFQRGKFLSCGAGGGIIARSAELMQRGRRYLELGWYPRELNDASGWESGWRDRAALCQSGRMPDVAAALLLSRLAEHAASRAERIHEIKSLLEVLRNRWPSIKHQEGPVGFDEHRWRVALICPSASDAEALARSLRSKGSLAYQNLGPPPAEWPAFRDRVDRSQSVRTAKILQQLVLVPCGSIEDARRESSAVQKI